MQFCPSTGVSNAAPNPMLLNGWFHVGKEVGESSWEQIVHYQSRETGTGLPQMFVISHFVIPGMKQKNFLGLCCSCVISEDQVPAWWEKSTLWVLKEQTYLSTFTLDVGQQLGTYMSLRAKKSASHHISDWVSFVFPALAFCLCFPAAQTRSSLFVFLSHFSEIFFLLKWPQSLLGPLRKADQQLGSHKWQSWSNVIRWLKTSQPRTLGPPVTWLRPVRGVGAPHAVVLGNGCATSWLILWEL